MKTETVLMGNRKIDVQSRGRDHLGLALRLLCNGIPLTGYREEEGQLVLFWGKPEGATVPMLYPLVEDAAIADFVWGWLENKAECRERYPDGEVDNVKGGFRVWSGDWGRDERHSTAFGRVEARFAWLGK